jgi:Dolichyl-phosphate-mannose-protein mannosyltransferase
VTVSSESGHVARWLIPAGLFLASFVAVAVTAGDYGVTWDEPSYFHASDLHTQWLVDLATNTIRGEASKSLGDETIRTAWHQDPYHVPHPPFSRVVSGITKALAYPFIDKFAAYRLGPAFFFALLVTCMYRWMTELFGQATGFFSALALVVIPNLFAFAHIAVTDMPLASLWFLTVYYFWRGLKSWQWSALLGLVWGLALATKFPAVLIPIPLTLWAHLYYRKSYYNNVFAMLFLSPLIMILCQPYLWQQPGLRVLEFLFEGLSRAYRADASFPIFFLGQIYHTSQLPLYYPFFVIGVTTPEPILALALFGSACIPWLRERRAPVILFLTSAAFILVTGLLPGAVLHDGVRQLLPVLPFLTALAGVGFFFLCTWLKRLCARWRSLQSIEQLPQKIAVVMIVLVLFMPALDTYLSHPFQLAYYNSLVGGVRGAYLRGLEVTYFMEAFTPGFVKALNETLPANATVNGSFANFMLAYYQKEERLRSDVKVKDSGQFDYYVLLNRRSALSPRERSLVNGTYETFLSVTIAGVPLVSVFEFKKPS